MAHADAVAPEKFVTYLQEKVIPLLEGKQPEKTAFVFDFSGTLDYWVGLGERNKASCEHFFQPSEEETNQLNALMNSLKDKGVSIFLLTKQSLRSQLMDAEALEELNDDYPRLRPNF